MLFNESDAPHLKAWIVGRLANEYVVTGNLLQCLILTS